ncbi:MAG TPA: FecR family protein [Cyclobacteriaceae bacterium]
MKERKLPIDFFQDLCQGKALSPSEADFITTDEEQVSKQDIEKIYLLSELPPFEPNTERAWDTVNTKISKNNSGRWWYAAASIILLLGLAIFFIDLSDERKVIELTTSDTAKNFTLPDGSELWLNRNSSVKFFDNFQQNRKLSLSGEGYFEVTPDEDSPFIITTKGSEVKVIGTKFNLNSFPQNSEVKLSVISGIVQFKNGPLDVLLKNDESIIYDSVRRMIKKQKPDVNTLSWINGKLTFENTPLQEVVIQLSNHFQVKIKIVNEDLKKCLITSEFIKQDLKEILKVITSVLGGSYQKKQDQYYISGKGCN